MGAINNGILGRFWIIWTRSPFRPRKRSAPTLEKPAGMYLGGQYVASRTGTVYYYPWCSGGGTIPSDKAIWFATAAAAQAAGYVPAKNCKGLDISLK
jgi:hypothetical protein